MVKIVESILPCYGSTYIIIENYGGLTCIHTLNISNPISKVLDSEMHTFRPVFEML